MGIDNNTQIDAVLFDFSKAFEKVPHQRLLTQLHHYSVRSHMYNWISSFLSDRTQKVLVKGHFFLSTYRSHLEYLKVQSSGNFYSWRILMTCQPELALGPDCLRTIACCKTTSKQRPTRNNSKVTSTLSSFWNKYGYCISIQKSEVIVGNQETPPYNFHGRKLAKNLGIKQATGRHQHRYRIPVSHTNLHKESFYQPTMRI